MWNLDDVVGMELTIWTVRTEGFGIVTKPWKLSPSESGNGETLDEVTLKPANEFKPRSLSVKIGY